MGNKILCCGENKKNDNNYIDELNNKKVYEKLEECKIKLKIKKIILKKFIFSRKNSYSQQF